jgi:hypothetical protein
MEVSLLNYSFEILSYNGGAQNEEEFFSIGNVLTKDSTFHVSKKGENFILIMEYIGKSEFFTMDHIYISGPNTTSFPIKEGIIIISENKITETDLKEYTKPNSIKEIKKNENEKIKVKK